MIGVQCARLHEVAFPFLQCLLRQREDQIDADVVETCLARRVDDGQRFIDAVDAAEPVQVVWMKRLDTEAHAVDAGSAETAELVDVDGSRIGLQRDFGAGLA